MLKERMSFLWIAALCFGVFSCGKDKPDGSTPIDESNCNEIRSGGVFNLVPNLDFESWSIPSGLRYMDPEPHCFWTTPNRGSMGNSFVVVPQTVFRVSGDSAYSGNYAVMMETKMGKLFSENKLITGSITSGQFEININDPLNSLKLGQKFNKRPKTVSGYYMFFPVLGDSSVAECYVTKSLGNNQVDTLGRGRVLFKEEQSQYARFSFDLEYKSEETPDNIVVFFASSEAGDSFLGQPGSTLFIDDVKVDYHD